MIMFVLIACAIHKTTLTGVVDYVGSEHCTVELSGGEIVFLKSKVCKLTKEGDTIYFYARPQ